MFCPSLWLTFLRVSSEEQKFSMKIQFGDSCCLVVWWGQWASPWTWSSLRCRFPPSFLWVLCCLCVGASLPQATGDLPCALGMAGFVSLPQQLSLPLHTENPGRLFAFSTLA